jgi:RND superfamily putative drug exporter
MLGLISTFGFLGIISMFHNFDTTVQSMTSMIGLGVGIDYVLFIVRRFREELASGKTKMEAVAYTMATTGKAIFFSGITVLIAMAGLFWLQADIFTNIAIGTMLVVFTMMAVSLTLLPAILAILGPNVNRLKIRRNKIIVESGSKGWIRWSNWIIKNPRRWALLGFVILLMMSAPAFNMKLGMDTGAKVIADQPSGKGMALIEEHFSAGILSPVTVVVHNKSGELTEKQWVTINKLVERIDREEEVFKVEAIPSILNQRNMPLTNEILTEIKSNPQFASLTALWNFDKKADTTLIQVTLQHASDSTKATDWVRELRDEIIPDTIATSELDIKVGGTSIAIAELSDETWGKTPYVIATVLALSFILLLLAFRSIWIPLKAIVFNLLSVGASFGLLVWVFMGGHGAWLGIDQIAFIQVFLPVIAFAVLFGLSMDYEVFLVSRMKEEWGRTKNVDEAISQGTAHTSGPITQAAIIMIAVFLAFLLTEGDTQQIGFALGMAILIDVTIVRSLLVPSVMKIIGEKAWQMPKWLDKRLPHVELAEGEAGKSEL